MAQLNFLFVLQLVLRRALFALLIIFVHPVSLVTFLTVDLAMVSSEIQYSLVQSINYQFIVNISKSARTKANIFHFEKTQVN
jgi:hypothetical protein